MCSTRRRILMWKIDTRAREKYLQRSEMSTSTRLLFPGGERKRWRSFRDRVGSILHRWKFTSSSPSPGLSVCLSHLIAWKEPQRTDGRTKLLLRSLVRVRRQVKPKGTENKEYCLKLDLTSVGSVLTTCASFFPHTYAHKERMTS